MGMSQPPYPPQQPPPPGSGDSPGGGQPYGGAQPGGNQPYGAPPPPPGAGGQPYGSQPPYGGQAPSYGGGYSGGGMPPVPPGVGGPAPATGPYSPLDAISYGWRAFAANAGPFALMGLLMLVVTVGVQMIFNVAGGGLEFWSSGTLDPEYGQVSPGASLGSSLLQLTGSMLASFLGWLIGLAIMRGALDVVDTGRTSLGQMWTRIPWGQAFLAGLLMWLAVFVGFFALCVGAFVVTFFLWYVNVAVLDGVDPVDSLKASFAFVRDNLADNALLCLIGVGAVVATICTCYLGGIVLGPLMTIAAAYTWRALQGRPVHPV